MMNEDQKAPGEILLVEDNPGDIRLVMETLSNVDFQHNLHITRDGVEALEFLRHRGKYRKSPRPDIILLDLNLPKKNGAEVLAEIKVDENLRRIPVIVLTASQAPDDILTAYNLYANCYLVKPFDLDQFYNLVDTIRDFWFTKVTLPGR